MELTAMYPGVPFSPPTALADAIGAADTTILVEDGAALPDGPNLAVIGTDESGEVILYAVKAGNTLSGCTRGVEGTAQEWNAGSVIGRNWTNKDYATLIANLGALNDGKPDKAAPSAAGNLAALAADGSLQDSGIDPDSLATAQSVTELSQTVAAQGQTLTQQGEALAQKADQTALAAHTGNTQNPHQVTKAQVGLGNVDNTSDANKPVSTAQQQALNAKANQTALAALETTVAGKASKSVTVAATLTAAGWTGAEAPYTQTVAAQGVTADAEQTIIVAEGESITAQQYAAAAGAQLWATAKGANTVTVTAFGEKPSVDLPVTVTILG